MGVELEKSRVASIGQGIYREISTLYVAMKILSQGKIFAVF
jgi:hypothetical protein